MIAYNCSNIQFLLNMIGYLFKFIQWGIPIILILLVTIDVVKIVINADEKSKNETMSKIGKRLLYAVIIFFIPILIRLIFSLIAKVRPNDYGGGNAYDGSWVDCFNEAFK